MERRIEVLGLRLVPVVFRLQPWVMVRRTVVVGLVVTIPLIAIAGWPPGQDAPDAASVTGWALVFLLWVLAGFVVVLSAGLVAAQQLPGAAIVGTALFTEHLVLRNVRSQDAGALDATADAEALRSNGWSERTRAEWQRSLGFQVLAEQGGDVAICTPGGSIIGLATVRREGDGGAVALGWWLGPDHRGLGHGTEAAGALAEHLLARGVPSVRIGTSAENIAVQSIAAKLGAVETERGPYELPDGSTIESIWYELRPPETGTDAAS